MADARLGILMTADTKQAQQGLQQFNNTLTKTESSAKSLKPAVSKLGDTIETLRAKLLAKREFLNVEKDITKIAILNQEIKQLEQEILRVKSVGTGGLLSSVGFESVSAGASKAFSALRQFAYLVPGIGIAGILGGAVDGITSVFAHGNSELDKFKKEMKEKLAELVVPIEEIRGAAAGGAAGDIEKVNALAAAVLDQTKSYRERNRALQELKEINKNYFGDLTLEADKLELLKKRVNEYTDALIAQAVVKGFQDEIGKVSVELSKQISAYNKQGKAVDELRRKLEKLNATNKRGETGAGSVAAGGAEGVNDKEINKTQRQLDAATGKLHVLSGGVHELAGQMTELRTAIKDAVSESLKFKPLETPGTPNSGEENEIIARAKRIYQAYKNIIDLELGILPEDKIKVQLQKARVFIQKYTSGQYQLKIPIKMELDTEGPQQPKSEPTNFKPEDFITDEAFLQRQKENKNAVTDFGLIAAQKEADRLKKIADDMAKDIDKAFNDALLNLGVATFEALGTAIGEALAGGDMKDAFKAFADTLASGLQSLGKEIIKIGFAAVLAKKSIKNLFSNPFLAIAAGTALIAAGAALKSALNKGIPGRRSGGSVSANSPYIVGEVGEELFIPRTSGTIVSNANLNAMRGMDRSGEYLQVIPLFRNGELDLMIKRGNKFLASNV